MTSEEGYSTRSRRVDLLRGVAILAVLLLHFSLSYSLVTSPLSLIVPTGLLRAVIYNGNYGVTIFFVISGYLITSNSIKRYGSLGQTRLTSFYVLRAARILPPLLLALLIIVPLGCLGLPSFSNTDGNVSLPSSFFVIAVLSVLTFWHNLLMESVGYFNYCLNIYWSLSIEEVFYIAFPLVSVGLRRSYLIALLCIVLIAVAPLYRAAHTSEELYYMYGNFACFDAIALGCLTAMLKTRTRVAPRLRIVLTCAGALFLVTSYLFGIKHHEVWGFSAVSSATALLLYSDDGAGQSHQRLWDIPVRALRWLGRHSYELYLFHIILLAGLRNIVHRGQMESFWKLPSLAAFLAVSALLAQAVSRYFADPLNAALRRAYTWRLAGHAAILTSDSRPRTSP